MVVTATSLNQDCCWDGAGWLTVDKGSPRFHLTIDKGPTAIQLTLLIQLIRETAVRSITQKKIKSTILEWLQDFGSSNMIPRGH